MKQILVTEPGGPDQMRLEDVPRVQAVLDIFGGTLKSVGPVPDEAESEENE